MKCDTKKQTNLTFPFVCSSARTVAKLPWYRDSLGSSQFWCWWSWNGCKAHCSLWGWSLLDSQRIFSDAHPLAGWLPRVGDDPFKANQLDCAPFSVLMSGISTWRCHNQSSNQLLSSWIFTICAWTIFDQAANAPQLPWLFIATNLQLHSGGQARIENGFPQTLHGNSVHHWAKNRIWLQLAHQVQATLESGVHPKPPSSTMKTRWNKQALTNATTATLLLHNTQMARCNHNKKIRKNEEHQSSAAKDQSLVIILRNRTRYPGAETTNFGYHFSFFAFLLLCYGDVKALFRITSPSVSEHHWRSIQTIDHLEEPHCKSGICRSQWAQNSSPWRFLSLQVRIIQLLGPIQAA